MRMKTSPNYNIYKTPDVSAVILYSLIILCVGSMKYGNITTSWKNYGSDVAVDGMQLIKTS